VIILPGPKTDKTHTDLFRNALAFFLVTSFVSTVPLLVFKTIPVTNKEIIVYMLGQLSGMATMALGFYFTNKAGQDALDSKRAESTGKLADAVVAAANAPGPPPPPPPDPPPPEPDPAPADAVEAADQVAGAAVDRAAEIRGDSP
jgi:hypothetical protein